MDVEPSEWIVRGTNGLPAQLLDAQYSANGWAYFYPDGAGGEISEVYVYPQAGRHGLLALEFSF